MEGEVEIIMKDVNLDVSALIEAMTRAASPRSLNGRLALGSFKEAMPENMLRFLFEHGEIWVQRPMLWAHPET